MQPIDFFFKASRRFASRVAVESPARSVTYAELAADVQALANALQDMPSTTGRVGISAGNSIEHIIAFLAVLAAGRTWIPLNPRSSAVELDRVIAFTRPDVVFAAAQYGSALCHSSAVRWIALDTPFRSVDTTLASILVAHAGKKPRPVQRDLTDVQAIKFTGGSTGLPKGVVQSTHAWVATLVNLIDAYRLDENTRHLLAAPMTHGAGTYLLPVLAKGGCHVLLEETRPEQVLEALERRAVSVVFMPPTLFYMVMEVGYGRAYTFASLKHLIYGGAPMPVEKIRQAQSFFGPVVGVTYGQTEAPQIVTYQTGAELMCKENIQSVGHASMFSDFAIMDVAGNLLPPGETGEIVVRGPMIMSGYLEQPEKTAETIVDGWLHTGDLGFVDDRGYLFLRGRRREVIITGGFNVYPVDVEDSLDRHPAVHECAVYGVPDEKWGEAVCAAVQLKPGQNIEASELIAYAKEQLGSVKAPKHLDMYDSLPRSAVGKVDKQALRRMRMEIKL